MPQDKRYKVEGYWDCQYCGRTGIRGRFKSCPGCGHGRDASVKFYTKGIGEENAIDQEEFNRETAEANKYSRSDSVHHTEAQLIDSSVPSLFSREEGQGTGGEGDATDSSDWYCDYCDSYNPATANFCSNCGAAREQSSGKTYEQVQGKMARTYDSQGNLVKERDLSTRRQHETPKPQPQPKQKNPVLGCLIKIGIVLGAIIILGLIGRAVFGPKPQDITIESFDWKQTIDIEELQTVQESDWELPSGGRLIRTSEEVRSYNHVVDHYETEEYEVSEQVIDHYETYTTEVDNGDGTFDVEEHSKPVYTTEYHTKTRRVPIYVDIPVYDTKYYYDIERWVKTREVTTEGTDHDPQWGTTVLSAATGDYGTGEEREGEKHGEYGVTDSEGTRYTADLDFWQTLKKGKKLKVMVDSNNHITPAE